MNGLKFVQLASGLLMGYVEAGSHDGEPVILLHGFPEFHYSWRFQLPALAQAGFRAIAPDQRGYNRTDKTPPYDLDTLAQDIAQLQDALGISRTHMVGHNWGGVVAYAFARRYLQRTNKLVIVNVPHINAYLDSVQSGNWRQWLKSWYVYAFQLPWLPEWGFARNNYKAIERAFAVIKHMTGDDIEKYKQAYAQPGAPKAMIGWYRALAKRIVRVRFHPPAETVSAPTLVIWGEQDIALDKRTNDTLQRYVPQARVEYLPGASHWVMMDEPERVNRLMLDFLDPS